MAVEFKMPKLGMTMKKGIVSKWLKREGDPVAQGELIAEIMTEKITIEIESPGTGILKTILVPLKKEVPVGTTLAWIGAVDEAMPVSGSQPQVVAVAAAAASAPAIEEDGRIKASPAARRVAKEHGIDLALVSPSGSDGRISSEDVLSHVAAQQASAKAAGAIVASEAAKRLAQERGVDLAAVAERLGEKRRLTTEDVESYLEARGAQLAASPRAIPLVGMRKMIADHLVQSLHNAAQLTVSLEVDATELVRARELILPGFQAATGIRPTFTDLLIVLVARALQQHPILNSTLVDDEIILHEDVNMGVAVAIDSGLIVPVIHQAQTKSLGEITQARSELARKALEGRLGYEEILGGTFTITNPGGAGSDIATPILNSPENAILGVGRIVKKPAVHDDEICIRHMLWLNLTFDHRAMDGVPAARFLETLNAMIQEPLKFLEKL